MLIYSRFIHLLSSARDNLASEFLDPCGGTLALRYYVFTALMIPNLEVVDSRHVGPSNHFAVARQVRILRKLVMAGECWRDAYGSEG